ncbi:hypothetical protein, partial [Chromobacterium amazonense]|uniref:hypothetical protein n=1 Tax=Chromobacterium amazonense TaxID=1382803 RepID=UPI003F7A61A1
LCARRMRDTRPDRHCRGFAVDASLTQEVVVSVVGLTCVANMASFCENARRMLYAKHIIHDVI